jgi:restriction system protein
VPIPDYQSIMLPLLKLAGDNKEHSTRDAIVLLGKQFNLSDEEMLELLPSGQQKVFDNRVGWARTYLKMARLLESRKRSYFNITDRGLGVLNQSLEKITVSFLEEFPEFMEFKNRHNEAKGDKTNNENGDLVTQTPEELLEDAYQRIRQDLAQEILDKVKECTPGFFERLVIDLLLKMGYGGSRKDAGKAIGKSGDEGIDGIIKEDRLGLDIIYVQAKRWEGSVGRPEIQKFVGALAGQRAKKGVFITTSSFTNEAINYVLGIDSKIVLIDGEQLAQFMIDFDIGVSKMVSYEVKKIDTDYFTED